MVEKDAERSRPDLERPCRDSRRDANVPRRKRNRCLIPISGFFEWEKTPDGKQPYYITRVDGTPITVAGL